MEPYNFKDYSYSKPLSFIEDWKESLRGFSIQRPFCLDGKVDYWWKGTFEKVFFQSTYGYS